MKNVNTSPRPLVDWEAVERDYRPGVLSLAEIGRLHGVTKGRISQVSKRDGWVRDLAARIKVKAEAKLNEAAVNAALNDPRRKATDEQTVEAVAALKVNVLLGQRGDVAVVRVLQRKLAAELTTVSDNLPALEELGDAMRSEDERGQDKRNDLYRAILALPARIKATRDLSEAQRVTVELEGRLFGIAGGEVPTTPVAQLTDEELTRRLQHFVDRAALPVAVTRA